MAERSSARRREVLGSILTERLLDAARSVALFALLTAHGRGRRARPARAPAFIAGGRLVQPALRPRGLPAACGRGPDAGVRRPRAARGARLGLLVTRAGVALAVATGAVWLAEAVIFWLVGESLGLGISVLESALVVVLASFFALIPAAPGYVGTYDAAVLFALHALDVPGNERSARRCCSGS